MELVEQGVAEELNCVSGHMGVAVNGKADEAVKEVAERSDARWCPERFVSLALVSRTVTEH